MKDVLIFRNRNVSLEPRESREKIAIWIFLGHGFHAHVLVETGSIKKTIWNEDY